MAFSYLPHTADIKFLAYADSLEEAFSEAARAVTHVMTESEIKPAKSFDVSVKSESADALLFDFLSEIILLLDTEGIFIARADLHINQDSWHLEGKLVGDDASNYERHGDVKAPTYNGLAVKKTDSGWELSAVLDI